jgi:hypothetical protein
MPRVVVPGADYWRLRFMQEVMDHATTRGRLAHLIAVQAHGACFTALAKAHPALATAEVWTLDDATLSLTAPDAPPTPEPAP